MQQLCLSKFQYAGDLLVTNCYESLAETEAILGCPDIAFGKSKLTASLHLDCATAVEQALLQLPTHDCRTFTARAQQPRGRLSAHLEPGCQPSSAGPRL